MPAADAYEVCEHRRRRMVDDFARECIDCGQRGLYVDDSWTEESTDGPR